MKTSEMRKNFPEFTDQEFRIFKQDVDTMVWEGFITMEERNCVLEEGISVIQILDERGI